MCSILALSLRVFESTFFFVDLFLTFDTLLGRFKPGSVSRANTSPSALLDPVLLLDAFAHRAATCIHIAHQKMEEAVWMID